MDTSIQEVTFDDRGACNFCREYDRRATGYAAPGAACKQELQRIVDGIKSRQRRRGYDAIIGLSGGLDSSYAAYVGTQVGLRLLGVHVDNGWDTEVSASNIQKIADGFDIPLVSITLPWEEFKELQVAFFRSGISNLEIPTDNVVPAALYEEAHKRRIYCLVGGNNFVTEGILPSSYGHSPRDLRFLKAIFAGHGNGSLGELPLLSLRWTVYLRFVRHLQMLPILNYVTYDVEEAKRVLAEEIGWEAYGRKHYESTFTRFFQGYILPTRFGIDKRRAHFSTLICSGQMSRDEALVEISKSPYPTEELTEQDKELVLTRLGLSNKEFEELMQLPHRTWKEYPNSARLLALWKRLR